MTEKLDKANTISNMSTAIAVKSLEEKTMEACTQERALEWYPKAKQVVAESKKIRDAINGIRQQETIHDSTTGNLIKSLFRYRQSIESVDTTFTIEAVLKLSFINRFLWDITGDSIGQSHQLLHTNRDIVNGYLAMLETDIKIAENRLVHFCDNKVGGCCWGFFSYSSIVGQNSSILGPGEKLTITAGIGAYSRDAQPEITINNKQIPLNEEGYSEYSIKAPQKPGSYSVPVTISFTDPITWKPETKQMRIEYTVAKKCNE
jgi:hypothetical protein